MSLRIAIDIIYSSSAVGASEWCEFLSILTRQEEEEVEQPLQWFSNNGRMFPVQAHCPPLLAQCPLKTEEEHGATVGLSTIRLTI